MPPCKLVAQDFPPPTSAYYSSSNKNLLSLSPFLSPLRCCCCTSASSSSAHAHVPILFCFSFCLPPVHASGRGRTESLIIQQPNSSSSTEKTTTQRPVHQKDLSRSPLHPPPSRRWRTTRTSHSPHKLTKPTVLV